MNHKILNLLNPVSLGINNIRDCNNYMKKLRYLEGSVPKGPVSTATQAQIDAQLPKIDLEAILIKNSFIPDLLICLTFFLAALFVIGRIRIFFESPARPQSVKVNVLYNVFVVGVLSFSIYLVISVFVAIPYINEIKKPSTLSAGLLDTAILNLRYEDTTLKMKDEGSDLFFTLGLKDSLLKQNPEAKLKYDSLPQQKRKVIDKKFESYQSLSSVAKSGRDNVIRSLNEFGKGYNSRMENFRITLVTNFQLATQNLLTDKNKCYFSYLNLFQYYKQINQQKFHSVQNEIRDADNANRVDKLSFQDQIIRDINTLSNPASNRIDDVSLNMDRYPEIIDEEDLPSLPTTLKDGND